MADNILEEVIKTSIDTTEAIKQLQDLTKQVEKSLQKIDKLSSKMSKDIADGIAPVKDIKKNFKAIEDEGNKLQKSLTDALKIKASVDDSSLKNIKGSVADLNKGIDKSAKVSANSVATLSSSFTNLDNVVKGSSVAMQAMQTATIANNGASVSFGKLMAANTIATATANSTLDRNVKLEVTAKEAYETNKVSIDNYSKKIAEYQTKIDSLRKYIADFNTTNSNQAKGFDNMGMSLEDAKYNLEIFKNQCSVLNQEVDRLNNEQIKLSANFVESKRKIKAATKELSDNTKVVSDNNTTTTTASKNWFNLSKGMQSAQTAIGQVPGPLGKIGSTAIQAATSIGSMSKALFNIAKTNPVILGAAGLIWAIKQAWDAATNGVNFYKESTLKGNAAVRKEMEIQAAAAAKNAENWSWWGEVIQGTTANLNSLKRTLSTIFSGGDYAGMRDAEKQGAAIADQITKLEAFKRETVVANAEFENTIAEKRYLIQEGLIEKDGQLVKSTHEERLKQLEEIKLASDKVADNNLRIAQAELQIIKDRNAIAESGEKDLMAEAQAQAKVSQVQEAANNKKREQIRIQKQIDTQLKADIAEEEERRKLIEEQNKLLAEQEAKKKRNAEIEANMPYLGGPIMPGSTMDIPSFLSIDYDTMAASVYGNLQRAMNMLTNEETALIDNQSLGKMLFGDLETFTSEADQFDAIEKLRLETAISANESLLMNADITAEERTRIETENAEARMAIADIEYAQRERQAQGVEMLLSNLQDAFDTHTVAYKLAASADAMISGIKGAQESYTSLAGIPIVGPALGIASATASMIATGKRIKQIWAVKKGQKNAPSDPSQETAKAVQPNVVKPMESFMSNTDIELQNQRANSQRVYVVYDDINQAGNRVKVVNNESSF